MLSVSLGPFALALSQLLLLGAFALALVVGTLVGRKHKVPVAGTLMDLLLVALVAARVGFVALYFSHYQEAPWQMFDIRDGGFHPLSGLIGALGYALWRCWRDPALRRPLASATLAGGLLWGGLSSLSLLMHAQANRIPETAVTTLAGESRQLSELADGKPMVVNLWATWCPPCIREMPVLDAAQTQYPDVTFVFANQGEPEETIRQFLARHQLDLTHVVSDQPGALGRTVGSQALPTTLFFDAEGRQVDAHLGELSQASLAHRLSPLLAK
ncbi:TlpA disulfide reductase family protein [Marinobacter xestospongiae]|uniref:TlpA disulfide reductase family protein n=1 Tax=Marinobacter xestospongiae TaxID=994319 RepID=A0ABU3W2N5_9GAMM|nr:TlpA disulfide reductase family protein [Marinobacter xestospongiae]MDV2080417.1 TlpA disulfide reductase family protein [Marinobacter xestospongiae]